jgi:hypothetical protein
VIRFLITLLFCLCAPTFAQSEEELPNLPRPKYLFINSSSNTQGKDVYAGLAATLYSPRSFYGYQPFIQASMATSGGIYYSDGVKNAYMHKDIRFGAGVRFQSRFGTHSLSAGRVSFAGKTILSDDFSVLSGKKEGFYLTADNWFNLIENTYLSVFTSYAGGINRKTLFLAPSYHFKYFNKYQPFIGVEYSYSSDIGGKMQRYGFHFTGPQTRFGLSKFSLGLGNDGKAKPKPYTSVSVWRSF